MPKLFDESDEGGDGPAFLGTSAARVNGDALAASMMRGVLRGFER